MKKEKKKILKSCKCSAKSAYPGSHHDIGCPYRRLSYVTQGLMSYGPYADKLGPRDKINPRH